jgi:arginine exporter protein ArgO
MNPFVYVGLLLNSALYLVCVFVAGIFTHNALSWKLAIATMGVCYLCYLAQDMAASRRVAGALVVLSIILGVAAGLLLI